MKTVVVALVCFFCSVPFPVWAQQPGRLQTAETSFDYTLTTLRESVDKLSRENQNLTAANGELRGRLRDLKDELKSLQRDEARVQDQFEAVDARYQKKKGDLGSSGSRLVQLRRESGSIDEEFGKLSVAVAAQEKSDQQSRLAIEALEKDIQSLKSGVFPPLSGEDVILAQERDRLRQQSSVSLGLLQKARQQWLDLQSMTDVGPERAEALRKERDELIAILQDKKRFTADLLQQAAEEENTLAGLADPANVNEAGIVLLEQDLRSLKTRSQGLDRELEKLQQSDTDRTRKSSEVVEKEKEQWEIMLADGTERNKALRSELGKLRKGMVDLDKKKVALERTLYGK